jgi:phage terminase large subunit-like protein
MKELELELVKFPNAKHDDIIDSLSWAVLISQSSSRSYEYFNA